MVSRHASNSNMLCKIQPKTERHQCVGNHYLNDHIFQQHAPNLVMTLRIVVLVSHVPHGQHNQHTCNQHQHKHLCTTALHMTSAAPTITKSLRPVCRPDALLACRAHKRAHHQRTNQQRHRAIILAHRRMVLGRTFRLFRIVAHHMQIQLAQRVAPLVNQPRSKRLVQLERPFRKHLLQRVRSIPFCLIAG